MKSKRKKRCISCLRFYSAERDECPYCGYKTVDGFIQPYHDALSMCSVIDYLRIGRALQNNENKITYIGIDTIKNKIVQIEEFFPYGYVQRNPDGSVVAADSSYTDIIEQAKEGFIKENKHTISRNGTVYSYHRLKLKNTAKKDKKILQNNIAFRSIIGKRKNQEDSFDYRMCDQGLCAVLCDGMGGINGGETASSECVRIMMEISDTVQHCDEGILPTVLRNHAIKADKYIASLQDMDERRLQCGTTLLFAVTRKNRLYIVSVGDSHIYLIHDNDIRILTEDHNYFTDLMLKVKNGETDYETAVNHPKREALTSYIGIGSLTKIHVPATPTALSDGDYILLCSDGLYRALTDDDILNIITSNPSVDAAADVLLRTVEERNLPSQDNTTFIIYRYDERRNK